MSDLIHGGPAEFDLVHGGPTNNLEGPGDDAPSRRNRTKRPRGFALLTPQQRRQIASKGGKAAHEKGTAHEFTPEEARAAGRKGGLRSRRRGAAVVGEPVPAEHLAQFDVTTPPVPDTPPSGG